MSDPGQQQVNQEHLDPELEADFQELVERTVDPGVKKVLERNKTKLVKREVTSEKALQALTEDRLKSYGLSEAAAGALKLAFPTPTAAGAGGAAGGSGTGAITIVIDDPEEKPDLYEVTFKNAQRFDSWMARANIAFLFKGGQGPGVEEFSDLIPGAVYTTAVRSIPSRVRNLDQYREHMVRRREHEATLAVISDLLDEGAQMALEFPEGRIIKDQNQKDVAEVDISVKFVDAHGQPGFVLGSAKTHVSGDSDVRGLVDKLGRYYEPRFPFKGHRIEPAFMTESLQPGKEDRLRATCKDKGVRLYARNGRSISRVQLSATMAAGARVVLF